jgi:cysteinyl-tRNA synthetase
MIIVEGRRAQMATAIDRERVMWLIRCRELHRRNGSYQTADEFRERLHRMGVTLSEHEDSVVWDTDIHYASKS